MRTSMLIAATAGAFALCGGAASAQVLGANVDGAVRGGVGATDTLGANAGSALRGGARIDPGLSARTDLDARANVRAPEVQAPARVEARAGVRGASSGAPYGYAYGQQTYAHGEYVWYDNRGWVWVPRGAAIDARGSADAAVRGDVRSNVRGRAGGRIR